MIAKLRSHFDRHLVRVDGETAILVVDLCDEGSHFMSVTNDADAVVEYLISKFGSHPIYYKDSMGQWDELKHDGREFTDFAPISPALKTKFNLHNL